MTSHLKILSETASAKSRVTRSSGFPAPGIRAGASRGRGRGALRLPQQLRRNHRCCHLKSHLNHATTVPRLRGPGSSSGPAARTYLVAAGGPSGVPGAAWPAAPASPRPGPWVRGARGRPGTAGSCHLGAAPCGEDRTHGSQTAPTSSDPD